MLRFDRPIEESMLTAFGLAHLIPASVVNWPGSQKVANDRNQRISIQFSDGMQTIQMNTPKIFVAYLLFFSRK